MDPFCSSPFLTLALCVVQRPLKAQQQAELAAAGSEEVQAEIRAAFEAREKAIEHEIDHRPMEANIELSVAYNFLSK